MGLLDRISSAVSGATKSIQSDFGSKSSVSIGDLSKALVDAGDQIASAKSGSADAAPVNDLGLHTMKGKETGSTIFYGTDFNDGVVV